MSELEELDTMHDETASASELFLTFLQWARAASERASEKGTLPGMTLGMDAGARHGSCFSCVPIEVDREASVREL